MNSVEILTWSDNMFKRKSFREGIVAVSEACLASLTSSFSMFWNFCQIIFFQWDSISSCCCCRQTVFVRAVCNSEQMQFHSHYTQSHLVWEMAKLHEWSDLTQVTHLLESLLTWHFLQLETQHLQDHMTRSLDLSQEDRSQH